jgi:DNA-binding PadR family transcriptional regulator
MGRESLGEFEQLVLLACLQLESKAYAVSIIDTIEKRTGRSASHAAVYVALRRLEKKGLVESSLADPTPERGGRAKRFFSVSPRAVDLLRESREALLAMWQGLEQVAK